MKRLLATCSLALFAAPFASAQMDDFMEVFVVRVKPERRAEFDVVSRKVAEANRKAKGDTWLASEVAYGEGNTIYFVSTRKDYAAMDTASDVFMKAIEQAYQPGGMKKMMADFNNTIMSSRSEIRRRRWDLSVNPPKDMEGYTKVIGDARWVRNIRTMVRPGHQSDFEECVKQVKAAFEQGNTNWPLWVSQTVAGEPGIIYYVASLQPSLAAFDSAPSVRKLMGDEAFTKWQKAIAEATINSETMLMRFVPEISNPPEALTKVTEFWRAKPAGMTKPKPAEMAKAPQ